MEASVSKTTNLNKNFSWPGSSALKQYFNLPSSIIYFISKNPSSPEAYQKLVQSCKYFFEKLPLLIVKRIIDDNGRKMCTKEHHFHSFDGEQYMINNINCCVNIDFNRNMKTKIWLTSSFSLLEENPTYILSKLYQCENALFHICQIQMTMEKFKIYAAKFQKFSLYCIQITDKDGNVVMLEEIIKSIPIVKEFEYTLLHTIPPKSAVSIKNISNLKNLSCLRKLALYNIPELIAVKDFWDFIKDYKNTKFIFGFPLNISEIYKNQLNVLVDTIINCEDIKCVITYYEQDEEKFKIMKNRCDNFLI